MNKVNVFKLVFGVCRHPKMLAPCMVRWFVVICLLILAGHCEIRNDARDKI